MNSLAYLSRQFDVLASAKTPPSTPTSDRPSFIGDRHGKEKASDSLQRVSTWSTKSPFFSTASSSTSTAPKRSFSSPTFASLKKLGLKAPRTSTISADVETPPRLKPQVEHIIRRIFFIRVFVLVWDNLHTAWLSLWSRKSLEDRPIPTPTEPSPPGVIKLSGDDSIHQPATVDEVPAPSAPSIAPVVICANTDRISPSKSETELLPSSLTQQVPLHPTSLIRTSETPVSASRSSTPLSGARKTPFHLPKTLVLDLDETLIHSTSRPMHSMVTGGSGLFGLGSFGGRNKGASHMVEVVLGGRSTLYHVYKRPFVDFFLRTVSGWYTLVIFTASMQEYADPVIDWLDAGRGILAHRLFRDSCTQLPNGSFTKDLSLVEADLSRVCLVDNSPVSYRVNEANGIPIEGWTHDPSDEALLDLLPVLDSLRFTSDVRRVLGLRTAGVLS